MKQHEIADAIHEGATTTTEIADFVGVGQSNARRYLKQYAESDDSDITRERAPDGSGFVYGIKQPDADVDADLPVFGDREYEWAQFVPSAETSTYIETDGEKSDIAAIIDSRHATGQLPRFRLTGPPGTGKTTLARDLAAERQWPVIPIQFTAEMRDSELLGSPHIIGGESVWVDGPIIKLLLCSQVRPCVAILDEVNRAPFARKASLQSVLDHRAEATLQLRGGEVIEGDGHNLVTVATMNEGAEYETYPVDPAEKRRHGNTWEIPFLGMVDAEREATLVADETPITADLARVMVAAANDIRELALNDFTSPVEKGIATSTLLMWAQTAVAYRDADRPNPVRRAAETAILGPHYLNPDDPEETEAQEVRAVILDALRRTSRQQNGAGVTT